MRNIISIILMLFTFQSFGQYLLNGDFENNTAGIVQSNITNSQYNGLMANSFAFGTWHGGGPDGGNMDIITSDLYCGQGAQQGAWYVAFTAGESDAISLNLSSPLVVGKKYTVNFYDRSCFPSTAGKPIEIGISDVNNSFGNLLYTAPMPEYNGGWVQRTFSFIASIDASYITVRCNGSFSDIPWTHFDNITIDSCSFPLNIGNDTVLCSGSVLPLDATIEDATYLWQNDSPDSTFTVTQPGKYWVKVTLDNCSKTDTIIVIENKLPQIFLGNDTTLCQGISLPLDVTAANATYRWQDNSIAPIFNVVTQGVYWVKATNNCGVTTDSINVNYHLLPTVNLGNDTLLCNINSLTLDANNTNSEYLWQDHSTSPTFVVTQHGTYWVETSNICGKASDTIKIEFNVVPTINLYEDTILCQGDTLFLDATNPGATYLWEDNSETPTHLVAKEGVYSVNVVNNCGSATDMINVVYDPFPSVELGNDTVICIGNALNLDVTTSNSTYLWQDNSTLPNFNVTQQGAYWVVVSNKCGSSQDKLVVELENCMCFLYIPNTFTPNGDDLNDGFSPTFDCTISEYQFLVFNRSGEKVFETNLTDCSWDGISNGKTCADGVYAYWVSYKFKNKNKMTKYGTITLIR